MKFYVASMILLLVLFSLLFVRPTTMCVQLIKLHSDNRRTILNFIFLCLTLVWFWSSDGNENSHDAKQNKIKLKNLNIIQYEKEEQQTVEYWWPMHRRSIPIVCIELHSIVWKRDFILEHLPILLTALMKCLLLKV